MANTRTETCSWSASMFADNSVLPLLHTRDCFSDDAVDPSGSTAARTDGGDVRTFQGGTELPREVVSWEQDSTTGAADAAIEVHVGGVTGDTVAGADVEFQYGDASLTEPTSTDTYGSEAVWTDYKNVWHGDSLYDSTGNANTLTATSGAAAGNANAQIGTSLYSQRDKGFTGAGGAYTWSATDTITISQWFNRHVRSDHFGVLSQVLVNLGYNSSDQFVIGIGRGGAADNSLLAWTNGDDTISYGINTDLVYDTWYHSVVVWDQSAATIDFHLDGSPDLSVSGYSDTSASDDSVSLGYSPGGYGPEVRQDEVRIRIGSVSANRIATEYANQSAPATYATAGTAAAIGGGTTTTLTSETGHALLTGYAPDVSETSTFNLTSETGYVLLTGYAPAVAQTVTLEITSITGSVIWTGFIPGLIRTQNQVISPDAGHMIYTGYQALISFPGTFAPSTKKYWLAAACENIYTKLGIPFTYNINDPGYIRAIAEALESVTGIVVPNNETPLGNLFSSGESYDDIAGIDTSSYDIYTPGHLRRLAEAMEAHAGQTYAGSYEKRIKDASEDIPL